MVQQTKTGWAPLHRIVLLWRPQWPLMAAGLVVALAAGLAGLAVMSGAGTHLAGLVVASEGHAPSHDIAALAVLLATPALMRLTGLARIVLRYAERLVTHSATFRALAGLRVWLFAGIARSAAGGLGFLRSGDLLSRLVGDVDVLDGLYLRLVVPAGVALLSFVVLVATLVAIPGVPAALVAAIALLFVAATVVGPVLAARAGLHAGPVLNETVAALRVAVLDVIVGLREIRVFGAEGRMRAMAQSRESALFAAQAGLSARLAAAGLAAFLCGQAILLCLLAAAVGWAPFAVPPLAAIAMVFVAIAAFEPVAGLPRAGVMAGQMASAAGRVIEAASLPEAAPDPAVPVSLPPGHALSFDQVGFTWAADRPAVFDGLSLDIPAGRRVAILGPSGSGKSSLAALALRLAEPQSGQVRLGGVPVSALAAADLRSRFAWLGQTTHLFSDTIAANLRLQRAEADEAELWTALEQAGIAEVVRGLPDGLDTWLGEAGAGLSGGQQRRIALARVLLSRAPVLILDEPCAGLDIDTERAFLETLNTVADDRTVVLITHRLLGVERLDRIWRLVGGRATAAAG